MPHFNGSISLVYSTLARLREFAEKSICPQRCGLVVINDLDDNILSNVMKFADDTTVFGKFSTDGDKQHLQNDIYKLVKRLKKWQMLFNFGKCKYLYK